MGTNYYFFTKNKKFAEKYFPYEKFSNGRYSDGYELTDTPEFGYEIHLCKLSSGWLPLFEKHSNAFSTFTELEEFYKNHKEELRVFDEYNEEYTWENFKDRIISHSKREKTPVKWVYDVDHIFCDNRKSLHTVKCKDTEAELYIPFRHDEYAKTEIKARKKFKVFLPYWMTSDPYVSENYYRDDVYDIDWIEGSFS